MTWRANLIPTLFDDMDRLMDSFGRKPYEPEKKDLHIEYAFPGVPRKDISLQVEDNALKVKVDHERAKFDKIIVTDIHDLDKIIATYNDGLLVIDVPLKAKPKNAAKEIEIKGS